MALDVTTGSYNSHWRDMDHVTTQLSTGALISSGTAQQWGGIAYSHARGVNTPGYFRKLRNGDLIPYTFWEQFTTTTSVEGYLDYVNLPNDWRNYSLDKNFYPDSSSGLWLQDTTLWMSKVGLKQSDLDSLVQAAASKIYSSGWDAGTFFAELHKVVRMFRNVLKNLIRTFSDPKFVFRTWLEGRYGWRILYFDILDIQRAYDNLDNQRRRFKERVGFDEEWVGIHSVLNSGAATDRTFVYNDVIQYGIRGSVIADISIPKADFNPILTAWEITPWSFVIDWFVSIGRALEAMAFLNLATQYSACTGTSVVWTRELSHVSHVWKNDWSDNGSWHKMVCEMRRVNRHPTSVSKLPSLDVNLNAFKVMDLIALFFSVFRR